MTDISFPCLLIDARKKALIVSERGALTGSGEAGAGEW